MTVTPQLNQRVTVGEHRTRGTVVGLEPAGSPDVEDTVLVHCDWEQQPRAILAGAVDGSFDQNFPLFAIAEFDEHVWFCTIEPYEEPIIEGRYEHQQSGRLQYMCYTSCVPGGTRSIRPKDQMMEITPEQFEAGRISGWVAPQITRNVSRLEEMGLA